MRIIGGTLKGQRLNPPQNLPVRPTTDMAKEALFNILANRLDFENLKILDLFSGTGNISIEFASRGALEITAVDNDFGCIKYLTSIIKQFNIKAVKAVKADVFKFLKNESSQYDLIFADPPYDLPALSTIPEVISNQKLLSDNGILIIEHPSTIKLDQYPNFVEQRKYGYSSFSFFGNAV